MTDQNLPTATLLIPGTGTHTVTQNFAMSVMHLRAVLMLRTKTLTYLRTVGSDLSS